MTQKEKILELENTRMGGSDPPSMFASFNFCNYKKPLKDRLTEEEKDNLKNIYRIESQILINR